MPKRVENPFFVGYCPELDVSPVLGPDEAFYYKTLKKSQVATVHINIDTEVSILSSYLAMPRQGHLKTVLHAMSYMKFKHNLQSDFDHPIPI